MLWSSPKWSLLLNEFEVWEKPAPPFGDGDRLSDHSALCDPFYLPVKCLISFVKNRTTRNMYKSLVLLCIVWFRNIATFVSLNSGHRKRDCQPAPRLFSLPAAGHKNREACSASVPSVTSTSVFLLSVFFFFSLQLLFLFFSFLFIIFLK